MPYSPSLVANAFLYKAQGENVRLTHMKLQKLVFFLHAWGLALHGVRMVTEQPEAWTYGPVFDSLYHELKQYGSNAISGYLEQMNPVKGLREPMVPDFNDTQFWDMLQQVWDRYGSLSAMQLSALTHEAGGPWEMARQHGNGWLADDAVGNHYRAQLQHG